MDEELARWVRIRAAERQQSVSRFLSSVLLERMRDDRTYESAKRRNLSLRPVPLKDAGIYPSREEIHDRPLLRR